MLKPLGYHAQCQCLNPGLRFLLRSPVRKDAGQVRDLGYPAPIRLALEFNLKRQRSLRQTILAASGGTRGSPQNTEISSEGHYARLRLLH
jgi:hypothetical protein